LFVTCSGIEIIRKKQLISFFLDTWPAFNLTEGSFSDDLGILLAPGPYRNNNDIFSNFAHGFNCLAGYDSEQGDICESLGYLVVLEIVLYALCGVFMQHALAQTMRQTQNDFVIAVTLAVMCGVTSPLPPLYLSSLSLLLSISLRLLFVMAFNRQVRSHSSTINCA